MSSRLPVSAPRDSGLDEHVAQRRRLGGPAKTACPRRFAVNWQSSAFWEPPPTMWIVSMSSPPELASRLGRRGVRAAGSRGCSGPWPRRCRRCLPRACAAARIRRGMSPGAMKVGIVDVDAAGPTARQRGRFRSSRCSSRRRPSWAQVRSDSCRNHNPPTLRRKRIRSSTPRSLVKFACRGFAREERLVELGATVTRCRSRRRRIGDRSTAWPPRRRPCRATHGGHDHRRLRPVMRGDVSVRRPEHVARPAARSGKSRRRCRGLGQDRGDQVPVRASRRPVVDALVTSVPRMPVSQ